MKSKMCTKLIITEVQKWPILWSSEQYYDKNRSDRAWEHISAAVGLPKEIVKSKWKNIKDHFTKEYKKIPDQCPGNSTPVYNGKWPHFQSLLFLKDKTVKVEIETDDPDEDSPEDGNSTQEPGSPFTNLLNETPYFDTRVNNWNSDTGINQQGISATAASVLLQSNPLAATPGYSNTLKNCDTHLSQSELHILPDLSYSSQLHCASQSKLAKKRYMDESPAVTSPSLEPELMTLKQQKLDPEDDDLNFMKSLLPYIKGLPPLSKLSVRSQMLKIVTQEMKGHSKPQCNTSIATQTTASASSPVLLFVAQEMTCQNTQQQCSTTVTTKTNTPPVVPFVEQEMASQNNQQCSKTVATETITPSPVVDVKPII